MPLLDSPDKQELHQLISHEIAEAGGYISFARFMELALYTPKLGYYSSAAPKFGKWGDFVTAPHLSELFSQSIARQYQQLKGSDILELGAGSGKLAQDLLLELEKLDCLPNHYFIFEKSEDLRLQQQDLLKTHCAHLIDRVHWLADLADAPPIKGMILANEVLDAMPVHCFRIENDEILERCIAIKNNQFVWKTTLPTTPELTRRVNLILSECPLPSEYESEVNLELYHWLPMLANILTQGVMLFLDYGYGRREYYYSERTEGTLRGYYQHQLQTDVLQRVGSQDITAHVDFTALVESAIDADLRLGGYTTQSSFLLACGLLDLVNTAAPAIEHYETAQAIKTLMLPSEMGELVKVMALTKGMTESLLGFNLHDRRRSL